MADRYWVGGTANWDGTAGTKWATTSGGAGGASVPTSADDVFFTNLSTGTCTISTGNTGAKSINCTGFTGTLAGSAAITVSGSVTLVAGMGFTYTNIFTINATGTLTTAGKSLQGLTIAAPGGTVTLGDALTIAANDLQITSGTFTTANYNVTSPNLRSTNSNTRTINLGSSTVTLSSTPAVNFAINTNLTFNAGTSSISCTATSPIFSGATPFTSGVTFYNVAFTSTTSSSIEIEGINTFNNLSVTARSAVGVTAVLFWGRQTINGTLSTTGTAGNRRVWFRSSTYGIAQTLTVNATPSLTDADFRDLYVIGTAAPISGTRVGDLRGCRGITFSTPKTVYWNQAAGGNWSGNNWAASSGGAVSTDNFPLVQDTAVIENTGLNTSATVTLDSAFNYIGTVSMSTRTNAMTFATGSTTPLIYGNWANGSGTTISGTGALTFTGRQTQTITSAGKTFTQPLIVDAYGNSVELADALDIGSNTLTVTSGAFDTKNYNVTAAAISSTNANIRTITLGSSTVTLSGSSPVVFTQSINLTFNAGTSQINCSSSAAALTPGGMTFYNVSLTSTAISTASILSPIGGSTFNNITITPPFGTGTSVILFNDVANDKINGTLTVAGASPVRRIFVRSDNLGVAATLTVGTLSATDCDFRDITIAGTAAGSSPTRAGDCGGNSGITFPSPKTVYWNLAGTQNWSATGWAPSSGGTPDINQFPLAQDTAVFDNTGSAGTVTVQAAWNIGTLNMSARTSACTIDWSNGSPFIHGNVLLGSGVTPGTIGISTFAGRGTQTITSAGNTWSGAITVDCVTGTVQLADALTLIAARTLTLTSGTFDAVTYNVTTGLVSIVAAGTKTLKMGSGTWSLTGIGTVWDVASASGVNFYKGSANIELVSTSTSARTFAGGGLSYNKLTIGGTTGTSTLTITGNNQFTELASTKTVAHTIALGSTAQTFGKWTVTGTAGNVVTLTGTGTSHVLAGAATSGIDYLAMGSIGFAATSPGEFYAGANSTGTAAAPVYRTAKPADSTRYWVGGTGNWSDTARWSTSSGGGSGASVPRSHDDVVFDSASNATAYTATVNAVTGGIRCKALTIAGPLVGNVTLAGSTAIDGIHGNVTLPATGLTRTYTGAITLSGSTSGKTLTTNGVTLASTLTVNGVGCEWTLGDALSLLTTSLFVVNNGSFDTANYNLTAGGFNSLSQNKRTVTFGSSTITLAAALTTLDFGTTPSQAADFTFNSNTSNIVISYQVPTFNGNGFTFYDVSFTNPNQNAHTINGQNTFNNLSMAAGSSSGVRNYVFSASQTVNGTFTCSAGANATIRTFVRSDTLGTTRTLTCAAVSLTDIDFRDITIAGAAAPATGTRIGDCKGNSGITFTAAANKYWNLAGGGNWSATGWATSSGGTPAINNFPLAQDTCFFEATGLNSGSTVTINAAYNIGTIDMSARTTNTMTLATGSQTPAIYGNWINGTGTTLTGTGAMTFAGRGSQTITSAGKTFTQAFTVDTPGGSVTLQDAFSSNSNASGALNLLTGEFNAATYNVTFSGEGATITTSGSNTRTMAFGSGKWTLAIFSFGVVATNLTVTGTGIISMTRSAGKTFGGGGANYSGITLDQGSASELGITGNNTFANITNTYKATGATTINFNATTQTVGSFTAAGEAGRVLTLRGSSAASPATLVLTSGTVTTPDYLTITGIRAYSLTTTWYAGANSTNNGSLGWYFEAAGGTVYSASFSDTATGADAVSVAASIFGAAYSETATGIDAFAASGTFNVSLSDTATGSDAVTSNFVFSATFSDTATGADTVAASASIGVSFSDTATGTDAISGALSTSASFSDTATGADAISARASFGAFFSDTATGADSISATGSFGVSFSDTATGADTPAVAASTFNASILDAAQALDTPTAGGTFNVSFSDAGAITDLVAGSYLWNPIDDSQTPNWQNVVTAPSTTWVEINDTQSPGWVEIQT